MASPACIVNGFSTSNGADVATAALITIALADTAGVKQWSLLCIGTDDLLTTSAINGALVVDSLTKTATLTGPAAGSALVFQSKVNNGLDANGRSDPSLTTTFGVFVLTAQGYRVAAFNETLEGSSAYGWITKINAMIRNSLGASAGAGDGLTYSAGAYNVVAGDGTIIVAADSIRVNAAEAATPSTIVLRSSAGAIFAPFLLSAPSSTATASGAITVATGDNNSTGASGLLNLSTGDGASSSGPVQVASGVASAGPSGGVAILSGAASGNGGPVSITGGLSTGSGRGATVTITGGESTNAGQFGGDVHIAGGAGGAGAGSISLGPPPASFGGGAGVIFIASAETAPTAPPASGFFVYEDPADNKLKAMGAGGVAIVLASQALQPDIVALTDNTGGVADNTLQAIPDPADGILAADDLRDDLVANALPAIRNNLADLAAKVNAIRTVLRNHGGIMA